MPEVDPIERIVRNADLIEKEREKLSQRRTTLRGLVGRVESRFRELVTELCDRIDPYSKKPLLTVETKDRPDGEKAVSVWAFDEYVLEIGTHERARGDTSETRRGFYAFTNIRGAFSPSFQQHIANMRDVTVLDEGPAFVLCQPLSGSEQKRYVLTVEQIFALFLESVLSEVQEDSRLYNLVAVT
jgi:hypothetical protein